MNFAQCDQGKIIFRTWFPLLSHIYNMLSIIFRRKFIIRLDYVFPTFTFCWTSLVFWHHSVTEATGDSRGITSQVLFVHSFSQDFDLNWKTIIDQFHNIWDCSHSLKTLSLQKFGFFGGLLAESVPAANIRIFARADVTNSFDIPETLASGLSFIYLFLFTVDNVHSGVSIPGPSLNLSDFSPKSASEDFQ